MKDVIIYQILLLVNFVASEPALRFRLIEPDEGDLQQNNLSMMKGSDLALACHTKQPDEKHLMHGQTWAKLDDENFANHLSTLKLYDLQKQDAGNYRCSHFGYRRQLSLKILYPVNHTNIQGPYTVKKGSSFQLTCHADSYPPPEYWWTTDPNSSSPIIGSGPIYTVQNVDREDYWLYCFAQNVMKPTFGDMVTSATDSSVRHITSIESAVITAMPEKYTFYVGSTVDIPCDAVGFPKPDIWWYKLSNISYTKNGYRLTQENVQVDFTGTYVCNAKNTVTLDNGKAEGVQVSRHIYVTINEHEKYDDTWAVLASIAGWILAVVVVLVEILLRTRRNFRKRRTSVNRKKEQAFELASISRCEEPAGYDPHSVSDSQKLKLTVACQTVVPRQIPALNGPLNTEQTARKQHYAATNDSGAFGSYEKF